MHKLLYYRDQRLRGVRKGPLAGVIVLLLLPRYIKISIRVALAISS